MLMKGAKRYGVPCSDWNALRRSAVTHLRHEGAKRIHTIHSLNSPHSLTTRGEPWPHPALRPKAATGWEGESVERRMSDTGRADWHAGLSAFMTLSITRRG